MGEFHKDEKFKLSIFFPEILLPLESEPLPESVDLHLPEEAAMPDHEAVPLWEMPVFLKPSPRHRSLLPKLRSF